MHRSSSLFRNKEDSQHNQMKRLKRPALAAGRWTAVRLPLVALLPLLIQAAATAALVTFDDLGLTAAESSEDGAGLVPYDTGTAFGETENWNRFSSGGVTFENRYIPAFGSWSRWGYSNQTDTTTPGFGNDLSAWTGGGADPATGTTVVGGLYGISAGETNTLDLPASARQPLSVMVTNTTYSALAMRDGDSFAKRFGGVNGTDPDYLMLKILGENGAGSVTGSIDFYLADYRSDDPQDDFIRNDWTTVDLTPLGNDVATIRFELSSSDVGAFGMNTPAYFAIDNLTAVPEPSSMMLVLLGFGCWCLRRTRSRHAVLALAVTCGLLMFSESRATAQGISANDARIRGWADSVESVTRGPMLATDHSLGYVTFGDPENALGKSDVSPLNQESAPVVSLGDGGQITVSFKEPIVNIPGPDFAVFENGFSEAFLELAFVEVSEDGSSFKRFPATADGQPADQIGAFGSVSASGLSNLAGLYPAEIGTPFDLDDVGLDSITHVRIIDVVGSIDPFYGSIDSEGTVINDPFPTAYHTGGFDLDAVAALQALPPWIFQPDDPDGPFYPTYEAWASAAFTPEQLALPDVSSMLVDPDADGMSNLLEYALWTDPNIFTPPLTLDIRHLFDEDAVEVSLPPIPESRPDIDYGIEGAGGMVYWQLRGYATTGLQSELEEKTEDFFRLVVEPLGDDVE